MKKYLLLFLFATSIFLVHYSFSGQAVWGDGIDYWVYLPSFYFDHDLNFENQYRHIYNHESNNSFVPKLAHEIQKANVTEIGKVGNFHLPGLAVVWLPAFFLADFFSLLFKLPRNGYADLYQIFSGVWSIVIGMFGLLLCKKVLNKFSKDRLINFISVVTIFLATSLLYYGSYDVLNSHFASFFLATLFWYLLFIKYRNWKHSALIGAVVGFATLVRIQDLLFIIPAATYIRWKRKGFLNKDMLSLGCCFLVTIIPIFLVWYYLYGKPFPVRYVAFWNFKPEYLGSLTHPTNGLFSRTPILLASLLGAGTFFKKFSKEFSLMFFIFVAQFMVMSLHGGWLAAAYGGRMYISALPFFAVCLSFLLVRVKRRWNLRYTILLVSFFSILNFVSVGSFILFEKEVNSGKKRGLEESTYVKLEKTIDGFLR